MLELDLNLLRIFDAVYRTRSVSRAASELGLSQPVTSQGLARLRKTLGDALFERVHGGVRPSPYAERVAASVTAALSMLDTTLEEGRHFDLALSRRELRLHMSDIGEWRFLPRLMAHLQSAAPHLRVTTQWMEPSELGPALQQGRIDFAFGFLPKLEDLLSMPLLKDRYVILVRREHPVVKRASRHPGTWLETLEFAAVRTHADTTRLLHMLRLENRLRLTLEHFTALSSILRETDLAAVVPESFGRTLSSRHYTLLDPQFPMEPFTVSLHWSKRFEADPLGVWFRDMVRREFATA